MIASKERQEDHQAYRDMMAILGTALDFYLKCPSEELLETIKALEASNTKFKEKLGGDYSEADARRREIDYLLYLSPCHSSKLGPKEV